MTESEAFDAVKAADAAYREAEKDAKYVYAKACAEASAAMWESLEPHLATYQSALAPYYTTLDEAREVYRAIRKTAAKP